MRLKGGVERRAFELRELRVSADGETPKIAGHAAVFNAMSEPLMDFFGPGYREQIAPGAFARAILQDDVRALWNHNADYPLGRNKAQTLSLREDGVGLATEILPPDTSWARDLMTSMRRGDVTQMSFQFVCRSDDWSTCKDPDTGAQTDLRTVLDVKLYDVSPVTYPAYPQTDVGVRSLLAGRGMDPDDVSRALLRRQSSGALAVRDRDVLNEAINILRSALADDLSQPGQTSGQSALGTQPRSLAMARRRLELAARD